MHMKTLMAVLALSVGGLALAQTPAPVAPKDPTATPGIDQRQANQEKRVDQGIASGQLTTKEAARMDKREDKLAAQEQAAKADGKVTRKERLRLRREAAKDSVAIHKQKHDKQAEPVGK